MRKLTRFWPRPQHKPFARPPAGNPGEGGIIIEETVELLSKARVERVSPLQGRMFYMRFVAGQEEIEMTARVVEVLSRERARCPLPAAKRPVGRQWRVFQQRQHWPLEVLRKEGLPLYWNEEWLRGELARLGSYKAIEKVHGYPNSTVSAFAKRAFGIETKPRVKDKKSLVKALRREHPQASIEEIARLAGVSKATAWRYLQG